ncbi:hypothetical protein EKK58_12205 [Candidatus Dependentiae bacterium]|nr:MAG: hypothetical protein EKK58_12205 [Candidatus Dependentiae bacterium]
MPLPLCVLLLLVALCLCGWAVFRASRAITETEIVPPDPEPRIVPLRPWQQASKTIVLSAAQQAELLQIYRDEFVRAGRLPEMPLLAFLRAVENQQREKPIEVDLLFAQLHWVRSFADEHELDWLRYRVDVAFCDTLNNRKLQT